MIPFLNIVLLSLDSEMISEDADLMSLDSDFTHYHFLMYINIAIGAIIFYYLYPWLRLFIDHYIIFRNREKIIIVGQSRMARTFAIDAASTGKKVTLITNKNQNITLHPSQIESIVVPSGALGGEGVLAGIERGLNIISVKNENILNIDNHNFNYPKLIEVDNYFEAAGLILAIREGINPKSIQRPLNNIQELTFNNKQS